MMKLWNYAINQFRNNGKVIGTTATFFARAFYSPYFIYTLYPQEFSSAYQGDRFG
jgi:hypothetical protein